MSCIGFFNLMVLFAVRMIEIWLPSAIGLILLLMIITRLKRDSSWFKRTLDDITN